jgi:hypothetical protein
MIYESFLKILFFRTYKLKNICEYSSRNDYLQKLPFNRNMSQTNKTPGKIKIHSNSFEDAYLDKS